MKAPFPWFGGKRRVADVVWRAFGDVDNYVEPFAGSLAVLLDRPVHHQGWQTGAETVNDADHYLANFWRALVADPEAVAAHADWPVNETDLFARHLWLVNDGRERITKLEADPEFYDAKVAGWWVWGQCAWIGSGWCSGDGPWTKVGDAGRGVNRKLPHLGDAGRGVNRKRPHLGNRGNDKPGKQADLGQLTDYMANLALRLKRVRVCCGDWSRVVTEGALAYGATVGVLLDPPYSDDVRTTKLYATDNEIGVDLSAACREWALASGSDPRLRIALCGYDGEHEMPSDWRVHEWASAGAYLGGGGGGVNRENRHKERIWFSPSCLDVPRQTDLWTAIVEARP